MSESWWEDAAVFAELGRTSRAVVKHRRYLGGWSRKPKSAGDALEIDQRGVVYGYYAFPPSSRSPGTRSGRSS